jgi:hypothetical protein
MRITYSVHYPPLKQREDGEKFIECDRSKGYRLSTHPDFVKWDKGKLREHPDPKVMDLIKRGKQLQKNSCNQLAARL